MYDADIEELSRVWNSVMGAAAAVESTLSPSISSAQAFLGTRQYRLTILVPGSILSSVPEHSFITLGIHTASQPVSV